MKPIKLPDSVRWDGRERSVDGAMERVLKEDKNPMPKPEQPITNAPNLDDYIYVPSINLYVAKERDLNGLTWDQAIDKIYTQGIKVAEKRAEMPTPFEFMTSIKYLLAGNIQGLAETERQAILDDILKVGDYRGNWLNAKFVKKAGGFNDFGIETSMFNSSGKPIKKIAPLEQCLWQDCWADVNSGNNQGLLTKCYGSSYEQGKNVYFWYPRKGFVARFVAGSDGAALGCYWRPDGSDPSLGVRLVVRPKGESPKK